MSWPPPDNIHNCITALNDSGWYTTLISIGACLSTNSKRQQLYTSQKLTQSSLGLMIMMMTTRDSAGKHYGPASSSSIWFNPAQYILRVVMHHKGITPLIATSYLKRLEDPQLPLYHTYCWLWRHQASWVGQVTCCFNPMTAVDR